MNSNHLFRILLKCENYLKLSYCAGLFVLNCHPESIYRQNTKGFGVKYEYGTKRQFLSQRTHSLTFTHNL